MRSKMVDLLYPRGNLFKERAEFENIMAVQLELRKINVHHLRKAFEKIRANKPVPKSGRSILSASEKRERALIRKIKKQEEIGIIPLFPLETEN
jgi:hypothetical protein